MTMNAPPREGTEVIRAVTVNRPRDEIYEFWRNFENFPRFMKHLESVSRIDERRSHWVATAPGDRRVEWDAEITQDVPGELIAWQSIGDSDVDNSGSVRFADAPGGRGTDVAVSMWYDPPAGGVGRSIAKLFHEEPEQQLRDDLRRFKSVAETGEIATIVGQPTGEGRYKEES